MNTEKVFKTKTGYCHILQDKIILTRDGVIGNISKATIGNNIARPLIIYGIIALGLFYLSIKGFNRGDYGPAFLFIILGLLLVFGILRSLNNSATPVIDRDRIKQIEFKKAVPGATRAYFIIHFHTDNGKIKRRLILLPGSFTGGQTETEKALQIMTEEFG
jgi:hypothetical protein